MIIILLNIPFTGELKVLQEELELAIREYLKRGFDPYLKVTCDYEKLRLHMDGIVFLERQKRQTIIHMRSGKNYCCYQSLTQLEKQLPESFFVRISGSTIINVRYLLRIRPCEATLQWAGKRQVREISRRNYRKLQEELRHRAPLLEE